jgi:hypothetical protein
MTVSLQNNQIIREIDGVEVHYPTYLVALNGERSSCGWYKPNDKETAKRIGAEALRILLRQRWAETAALKGKA